ncbi:hypothetical protein JCM17846_20310 [Iodidimonas nitroreducens]|uniref:Amino acid permease/ SLC12A domain-containing protein n=1 Tax=Iodidimonas nitroreducens TaxID=1236968 RepID=A0A5A7NBC7_9PROT|nr:amino acid permease [Iodidimonas nitroreducens]GAK33233.1 putative protein [alpha proteobacterium Q-1]GER04349.1 hypothetical protein JCM17846_20310 [Iodidimonas nitroreducens]
MTAHHPNAATVLVAIDISKHRHEVLFGMAGLWASGLSFKATGGDAVATGFVVSVALSILAFKGFTNITNSSAEITNPHRNVGRAIILSIAICVVVYLLVAFAVGSSLPLDRIVAAKDYALAEAARPALGQTGFYLTVMLALVATASGLIAGFMTIFFDPSRIASLGAFFYLVMDIVIHWASSCIYGRKSGHGAGFYSWRSHLMRWSLAPLGPSSGKPTH